MAKAIFAAGCFWGVEASFKKLPGVTRTTVGYTGGHKKDPTYEEVCKSNTGHAEAVLVEFDQDVVPFRTLVEHFFGMHNPTTLNRQGPDTGPQYRSAIFYVDADQREVAKAVLEDVEKSGKYSDKIVTELQPEAPFYKAEDYHQNYLEKQGGQCHL